MRQLMKKLLALPSLKKKVKWKLERLVHRLQLSVPIFQDRAPLPSLQAQGRMVTIFLWEIALTLPTAQHPHPHLLLQI